MDKQILIEIDEDLKLELLKMSSLKGITLEEYINKSLEEYIEQVLSSKSKNI
mgnify:CR=1 FL=1